MKQRNYIFFCITNNAEFYSGTILSNNAPEAMRIIEHQSIDDGVEYIKENLFVRELEVSSEGRVTIATTSIKDAKFTHSKEYTILDKEALENMISHQTNKGGSRKEIINGQTT